jgi:hypothetical protein
MDSPNGTAAITNVNGARMGVADFYAWGIHGSNSALGELGIRAVGAQSDSVNGVLTFAVNTFGRFVTPNVNEYDILINTKGSGDPNWVLFSFDLGKATGGGYSGTYFTILCDMPLFANCMVEYLARAPLNGSTVLMRVDIADLGLTADSPRFTYTAESYDVRGDKGGAFDIVAAAGSFNAFAPAISSSQFRYDVGVNTNVTATVSINTDEWVATRPLGLMIVTTDNRAGAPQAQLIPVR